MAEHDYQGAVREAAAGGVQEGGACMANQDGQAGSPADRAMEPTDGCGVEEGVHPGVEGMEYRQGLRIAVEDGHGPPVHGTIEYVNAEHSACIVVPDHGGPLMRLEKGSSSFPAYTTDMEGPPDARYTLVNALLHCNRAWCHRMATQFLAGTKARDTEWTLARVERLSTSLQQDPSTMNLQIIEVLGRGAYGLVFRCKEDMALKIGLVSGHCTSKGDSLARDWRFYQAGANRFEKHVPKLRVLKDKCSYAQIVYQGEAWTASVLAMEYLPHDVTTILEQGKAAWAKSTYVTDETRILAIEAFYALSLVHKSGFIHGDIKPDNMRLRKLPDGRQIVVFIDGGQSRRLAGAIWDQHCDAPRREISAEDYGMLVTTKVRSRPTFARGKQETLKVFGSPERPASPGYRIDPQHPADTHDKLRASDVHALAIVFLSVAGLEPGKTLADAQKFEDSIYAAVRWQSFITIEEKMTNYTAEQRGGGFHPTCRRWLQLIYEALCPDPLLTAGEALRSQALQNPNYPLELLAGLTTSGVAVYRRDINPVAMFLRKDGRAEFFTLLNSEYKECVADFKPRYMPGGGNESRSAHDGFLTGTFAQEIEGAHLQVPGLTGCIGAHLESAACTGDKRMKGSVNLPDSNEWETRPGEKESFCPMRAARRLSWGTRLTCDWSAGKDARGVQAYQQSFEPTQPDPGDFGEALALLRRQVLERGYRDAWNTDSSTHEAMTDELSHEASKNPGEGEQGEMHGTRDGTTQGKTTAGSTRAPLQGTMRVRGQRVRGQGTGGKRRHGTGKVMPGQSRTMQGMLIRAQMKRRAGDG
jgi:hypothetical protein